MDILAKKKELRKEAKAYRSSLSDGDRLNKSMNIINNLKRLEAFVKAEVILMYASLQDEVETLCLLDELLKEGVKPVYCPVTYGEEMEFYRILSMEDLKEGHFHVLEPVTSDETLLKPEGGVDYCMLMPGLMFDKKGNRLGYGKGYYDKYLARMPETVNMTTIALSYEALIKDEIPAEETDWKADYVVTENRVYNIYNQEE